MGEREVERADVVSFLRGEERKFSEAAAQDSMSEDGRERCYLRAATLRTVAAYIERGDHVRTAERTPEMVLRAKKAREAGDDLLAGSWDFAAQSAARPRCPNCKTTVSPGDECTLRRRTDGAL